MIITDNDNDDSLKMLRHLELIDDEAAEYEVKMVKIDDPLMAKKYGHREPPGLGFFRKGNYVKYEGIMVSIVYSSMPMKKRAYFLQGMSMTKKKCWNG